MKDFNNRINKWLFAHLNKKPPTTFDAYTNMVVPWIAIAGWFVLGIIFMVIPFGVEEFVKTPINYIKAIGGGLVAILVSTYFAWMVVKVDRESGLTNTLKEFALKRWHEKRKKYGLEE